MCGICLVIHDSSGSPGGQNSFPFDQWLKDTGLMESLKRRGPDRFGKCSYQLNADRTIHGVAHVLNIRELGVFGASQPFEQNDTFLLYNGEIYDGLPNMRPRASDTNALFELLRSPCDDTPYDRTMIDRLTTLEGAYAIVYFDVAQHKLWFCRDAFGRRPLLFGIPSSPASSSIKFILSSVASASSNNTTDGIQWCDLPAGFVFCLQFPNNDRSYELTAYQLRPVPTLDHLAPLRSVFERISLVSLEGTHSWMDLFRTNRQRVALECLDSNDDAFETWYLQNFQREIEEFIFELQRSVKKRVTTITRSCHQCQPNYMFCNHPAEIGQPECKHSKIALLFSGGVDSLLLAVLLAQECMGLPVDLLNVAFSDTAPDRITGRNAFMELKRLFPEQCKNWNFVKIDVQRAELSEWRQRRIAQLISPADTVLDDSIGCVLWFAARGIGTLFSTEPPDANEVQYTSPCRVLFLGSGADELLAGYSRHRKRYFDVPDESGCRLALIEELEMELRRIGTRNLGRDDRVVADHGRESRLPYLDEQFVKFVNSLPLEAKADLTRSRGVGEKLILRMALKKFQFGPEFYRLPKRAMQFGSRIAKAENRKEKGNDRCERLIHTDE